METHMANFTTEEARKIADSFLAAEKFSYSRMSHLNSYQKINLMKDAEKANKAIHNLCDYIENTNYDSAETSASSREIQEVTKKLYDELKGFQKAALSFSLRFIHSANLRMQYVQNIRSASEEFLTTFRKTRDEEMFANPEARLQALDQLAQEASNARNVMLKTTREKLMPAARQFSKFIKPKGLEYSQFLDKYREQFLQDNPIISGIRFSEMAEASQMQVIYEAIIIKSGVSNPWINLFSKGGKILGKITMVATLVVLGMGIASSKDTMEDVIKPTASALIVIGGSIIGEAGGEALGVAITEAIGLTAGLAAGIVLLSAIGAGLLLGFAAGALFEFICDSIAYPVINIYTPQYGGGPYGTTEPEKHLPNYDKLIYNIIHPENLSSRMLARL